MEKSIRRQQLVSAIQEYAQQKGMGAADVLRLCAERRCDVSESTIRRIIKADPSSENFSFDSLQRVSKALFDVDASPTPASEITTSEEAEREGLKAVNVLTDAALKDAEKQIAQLEKQLQEAEDKIKHLTDVADFRKEQLQEKDRQINKLFDVISKLEK